jgi:hypothetical protein
MTDQIKQERPEVIVLTFVDREGYTGHIRYIERRHIVDVSYSPITGALQITRTGFQMRLGPDRVPDLDENGRPRKMIKGEDGVERPKLKEVAFGGWGQSEVVEIGDEDTITEFMRQYAHNEVVNDPDNPDKFIYKGILTRREQIKKFTEAYEKKQAEEKQKEEEEKQREEEAERQLKQMREEKGNAEPQGESKVVSM